MVVARDWYRSLYPMTTFLITSAGADGKKQNVFTANWVSPCSFFPPLLSLAVGKKRFSHGLIREGKEFVVCIPGKGLEQSVMNCGSFSGRDKDKFKEFGLTPLPASKVKPPLIKECLSCLECRVVSETDAGDHTLFIAEVVEVHAQREGRKLLYEGDKKFV